MDKEITSRLIYLSMQEEINLIVAKYNELIDKDYDNSFIKSVSLSINRINTLSKTIINNDFILNIESNWWISLFSKTTYYRLKRNAMREFLEDFYVSNL